MGQAESGDEAESRDEEGGEALFDKTQAAALLGVSVRTIEAWVAQRRIPFVKLGEKRGAVVRFRPSSLREWIASQEVPPKARPPRHRGKDRAGADP